MIETSKPIPDTPVAYNMPAATQAPEAARPLADYFWIAGLDTQQLVDAFLQQRWSHDHSESNGVDSTIKEEATDGFYESSIVQSPRGSASHSRHDSFQRLSKLSSEARNSIQSLDRVSNPQSNRSSMTVRQTDAPVNRRMSTLISEMDFDKAMNKFATNRDDFYLDLTFNPVEPAKPIRSRSRQQTQRIVSQDEPSAGPNRNFGSMRRHLSFKDMSSTKRQLSMARRGSTRTSRRMSSYNSVIPNPENFQ